jgi:hypothetical protein
MDQLVLLVIIGLISLINWVMQKASEKREQAKLEREEDKRSVYRQAPPQRGTAARRGRAPQQDPLKELMEALGLPPEAAAPPPVVSQTQPEPEEEFASLESAPPPVPQPAPALPKPRWQPPSVRRPDEKTARLASSFASKEKSSAEAAKPAAVRSLLADRASKRNAVILSEILGQPRALRPAGALPY